MPYAFRCTRAAAPLKPLAVLSPISPRLCIPLHTSSGPIEAWRPPLPRPRDFPIPLHTREAPLKPIAWRGRGSGVAFRCTRAAAPLEHVCPMNHWVVRQASTFRCTRAAAPLKPATRGQQGRAALIPLATPAAAPLKHPGIFHPVFFAPTFRCTRAAAPLKWHDLKSGHSTFLIIPAATRRGKVLTKG